MHGKKWIKIFSIITLITIGIVGSINFIVDPLWNFNHENKLNKIQSLFNERQQKTNHIYFKGLDTYDGILLGSSRTALINQNEFYNMNIYNYAIESMHPFEYKDYLKFAKKIKGKEFKYIIIGADFYGSIQNDKKHFEDPSYYITNTKSVFYRYKMLFSLDAFKQSIKNIQNSLSTLPNKYYTRNNVKVRRKIVEASWKRRKNFKIHLKRHTEVFLKSKRNSEYINILKRLKKENPNTKFIIFTSAITADLLVSIIKNGKKIEEFENWLKEIIEVFGEVHHFMTINSITTNLQNYPDDDHLYPDIAKFIAIKLTDKNNSNIPKDFGIVIDKTNISEYMKVFKQQLKHYRNPLNFE